MSSEKREKKRASLVPIFKDEPDIDRVKRYFIGRELQKVWTRVSESGRQKIIKQYAQTSVIITEEVREEPLPGEDDSLPSHPFEEESELSPPIFEFLEATTPDCPADRLPSVSSIADLTEMLQDGELKMFLEGPALTEKSMEEDFIACNIGIEPECYFFEICCDDTMSKVTRCDSGCSYYSTIFQNRVAQTHHDQSFTHEHDVEASRGPGCQEEDEAAGKEGCHCRHFYQHVKPLTFR